MHVNMFALHNQLKKIDLSSDYDSKYIGCLLDFLFTQAELGVSSFSGKCSNFNGLSHSPLDPDKMDFIKGMYSDVWVLVSILKTMFTQIHKYVYS